MTKAFLRKEYLAKRMLLNDEVQQQQIEKIRVNFIKIQLHNVVFALSYMTLAAKKEIPPASIEKAIIFSFPDCQLCYPKIELTDSRMEAIELDKSTTVIKNKWGIAEPVSGNIISPEQIDVILVPLLCFDKRGYRVGYGKGFYDRYIARCRPDVMTIGLSFFEPVDSIEDVDEHDMPLKYCVTPQQLYRF